jgi:hypothetical protein
VNGSGRSKATKSLRLEVRAAQSSDTGAPDFARSSPI